MTLTRIWILHFLWILPMAALVLTIQSRKKRKAMEQFADPDLLSRIAERDHGGRRFLKGLFLILSLGMMLFALTGPRWGSRYQEVSQKGVDVVLAVDVSPSMMVEDIEPNRLERARREILDFLRIVQGDRVGLVAFSGAAFIQCPLTLDYAALQMFLSALQPDLIPLPGTDLGAAIEVGVSAFDFKQETDKVILLITDGEDNEQRGLEAAFNAREKGVKIFIFGMGEKSGGPIPSENGEGGFKKDKDGSLVLSKLKEESLREIASATGGAYVQSVAGDLDLDVLYFDGIKSRTEAKTLKSGKIKVYEERFTFFVLAAFLFLMLENLTNEKQVRVSTGKRRKRHAAASTPHYMIWVFSFLFLLMNMSTQALATEDPDELYRKGQFAEAEEAYALSDMDHPKDIRYRYNRGCAAYQNGDLESAAAAFSSVLRRAEAEEIRFKAAFNLGNTTYKLGDVESAIKHYTQAIRQMPSSEDARHNLELALRELEKQKKEREAKTPPQNQREQDQGKENNEQSETPGDRGSQDKTSKDAAPDQQPSPASDEDERKNDSQTGQEKHPEEAKGEPPSDRKGSNKQSPTDRSGELRALEDLPSEGAEDQPEGDAFSMMDKKKAEALLDNINEDRSQFLRFQVPEDKQHGGRSGKDW
jgi:Ca-activated chloride channel family protein